MKRGEFELSCLRQISGIVWLAGTLQALENDKTEVIGQHHRCEYWKVLVPLLFVSYHTFYPKLETPKYRNSSITSFAFARAYEGDANFVGGGQRWSQEILEIGMGVQHILGLLERGCHKFFVTPIVT